MLNARNLLLVAHVLSVVLFVGPTTLTASLFPGAVARAASNAEELPVARLLGRVSNRYAWSSLAVPAFGVALADESGFWESTWLHVSIGVHVIGSVLLFGVVLPKQRVLLASAENGDSLDRRDVSTLHAATGLFSLTWAVVLALMVMKPW